MFNLMCDDTDQARLSRERQKLPYPFYDEQANAIEQWRLAEPPPASVIIGELPQVERGWQGLDRGYTPDL